MLLLIFCAYLSLQFHVGLTAVVDTLVNEKDVQLTTEEHFQLLKEFQQKLQEIEETQEFLMVRVWVALSTAAVTDQVLKIVLC